MILPPSPPHPSRQALYAYLAKDYEYKTTEELNIIESGIEEEQEEEEEEEEEEEGGQEHSKDNAYSKDSASAAKGSAATEGGIEVELATHCRASDAAAAAAAGVNSPLH